MKAIRKLLLMDDHTCPWWLAYSWDHRMRNLFQNPDRIIKPYVKPGERVLDVGCGMGFFSIAMASYVGEDGHVHAVDIQQKMLDILMRRAGKKGVARWISPVLTDGKGFVLPEPLDFILTFWMLHEVHDKAALLQDLHARLKPGGRYLLVEPRVHVSGALFRSEVAQARKTGFFLTDIPDVWMSRSALFEK